MESNTQLDFKFLHNAAAGKGGGLADWIEAYKTLDGIPFELVAELIRNSSGCKKDVLISEILHVEESEYVDAKGDRQLHILKKTGTLRFFFKGANPAGRPKLAATTKKHNAIVDRYDILRADKKKIEIAYSEIAKEFGLTIDSVESIIKQKKKKVTAHKKTLNNLNQIKLYKQHLSLTIVSDKK